MTDPRGDQRAGRIQVARRLVVRGRVQGVFFRASTRQVARRHHVTGWARNRADGAVEVWLEGEADDVAAVEDWVRGGGPPGARVAEVDAASVETVGHTRFHVRG